MYILKGDMYQSIEIRCDQTVTKKLKSAERGNYLTVILKEYKASVQEKEFRKPAGAMPLFEDHSDHLIERFRLVAEGKQFVYWKNSRSGDCGCSVGAFVFTYPSAEV